MQKLDRNSVTKPACLNALPQGWRYDDIRGNQKQEIRSALIQMQKMRCAYCERRTGDAKNRGHIEHFRKQATNAALTTAWENLFWSCLDEDTCGKHKDKCDRQGGPQGQFNENHLLDPCVDDASNFLLFVSDGTVQPRPGISPTDHERASETIRVFNLAGSAFLRVSREDAVRPYIFGVQTLAQSAPNTVNDFVKGMLQTTEDAPFATAIRHFLESQL